MDASHLDPDTPHEYTGARDYVQNKRRKGLLLHFHDLPTWHEEEASRCTERDLISRSLSSFRSLEQRRLPLLQELSAMAAAPMMTEANIKGLPELIVDMVRAYMTKSAQIEIFGSFRDYYKIAGPSLSFSVPTSRSKSLHIRTIQHYNRDGELEGESRWYFRNGEMEYQEHYRSDQLHGVARSWYENGQLESEREWSEGVLHGNAREWYPRGVLKTHEVWQLGVREKVVVADGRKLTDRTRDFILENRLGAMANVSLPRLGCTSSSSSRSLDWLSLDYRCARHQT